MKSFKKSALKYLKTLTTILVMGIILSCSQTVGTDGGSGGGTNIPTSVQDNAEGTITDFFEDVN